MSMKANALVISPIACQGDSLYGCLNTCPCCLLKQSGVGCRSWGGQKEKENKKKTGQRQVRVVKHYQLAYGSLL